MIKGNFQSTKETGWGYPRTGSGKRNNKFLIENLIDGSIDIERENDSIYRNQHHLLTCILMRIEM